MGELMYCYYYYYHFKLLKLASKEGIHEGEPLVGSLSPPLPPQSIFSHPWEGQMERQEARNSSHL